MNVTEHWIDGKSAPGIGDRRVVIADPATGEGQSEFGDCHIYGLDGVRFYTRGKAVTVRWQDEGGVRLGFPGSD